MHLHIIIAAKCITLEYYSYLCTYSVLSLFKAEKAKTYPLAQTSPATINASNISSNYTPK